MASISSAEVSSLSAGIESEVRLDDTEQHLTSISLQNEDEDEQHTTDDITPSASAIQPLSGHLDEDEEFDDIHIDDVSSAPSSSVTARTAPVLSPPQWQQRLGAISPKSPTVALVQPSSDTIGTPVTKRSSLLTHGDSSSNNSGRVTAAAAAAELIPEEHTPRTNGGEKERTILPGDATPTAVKAAEIAAESAHPDPSRLSVDSASQQPSASGSSSPSTSRRPLFWGLLKNSIVSSTTPSPATTSTSTPAAENSSLSATPNSETSSSSHLPRLSLGSNAMAVSSAGTGRDSANSSNSGRNSLAPSFFGQPTSPSSPGPISSLGPSTHTTPEPLSRKASAFSPFATIMSNLRTRSSNATSTTSSNAQNDDIDGRSRLPRRDLDEDQLAEDIMRFADARHVLRTENSPDELRQLGLRLEEAWREKLAELNALRAKLEAAQDTVSDLEDENGNLRTQLGLLSEQVAARESDLEDFQRLTIGQIEAQRSLWEEEGREERENLQFSLAQAKRNTLEQKSINAQLRLVILGTLQGRLDGLTDWLAKQNDGETRRTSKRMSAQIGRRRDSLKSMMLKMRPVGEDAEVEAEGHGTNTSTPLMRQQTFETPDLASEADVAHSAGMASSAMDEVSSTTSGKAPGGSWSPKRSADGGEDDDNENEGTPRIEEDDDDADEDADNLFDIEDVLFNLPTSPSVPGRRTTMLFNEPLNLDQLRRMGFFKDQNGFVQDGSEDASLGGADGFISSSASFEKGSGAVRSSSAGGHLSPAQFALSPTSTSGGDGFGALSPRSAAAGGGGHSQQRLLLLIEKLQTDNELAEAARLENVMLQKRLDEEQRRASALEEALVQTKIRLEQTEAAVSDLFGGEGEEGDGYDGRSEEGGSHGLKSGAQTGLGLVTGGGILEHGKNKVVPVA
ncbi:hypothetical protein A4X13_0g489 [Tilletia indica]|uniref:Uncharacterized protein n=1 Tax=Tilletia indica TaxID=43049 RepID=A0A177TU65_9BASI|nr:hypothetical protein A4X13_0g489 [Tilletia indica]